MKVEAKTIDEYFANTGEREPQLRELDQFIQKTLPSIDRQLLTSPTFNGIAYGMFHYVYPSGREDDWPVITLAAQKNYISLYVMAPGKNSYLAEEYGKKLGKVNVGKSCIRFKRVDDLNLDEIKNILREAERWFKTQPKPKA